MTELIVDGDYLPVSDGGDLQMTEDMEQVIQEVLMHLTIRRGKFYPNKDYGTALESSMLPFDKYALACARQALDEFDGVCVKRAVSDGRTVVYDIMINNEERQVSVNYENL